MSTCEYVWLADRVVNEPGSRSQLGPIWHGCNNNHESNAHHCECGASK